MISSVQAVSVPGDAAAGVGDLELPVTGDRLAEELREPLLRARTCPVYGGRPTKMLGAASLNVVPVRFAPASELASRTSVPSGARSRSVTSLRFVCASAMSLIFTERTMPGVGEDDLRDDGRAVDGGLRDVDRRRGDDRRRRARRHRCASAMRLSIGVHSSAAAIGAERVLDDDEDGGTGGEAQGRAHDLRASAVPRA